MSEIKLRQSEKSRPRADVDEKLCCGKNIEAVRIARGLSRTQLAALMGITLGGVSAWEYGRTRPDIQSLKRLCEILNVSSDELLGIEVKGHGLAPEEEKLLSAYRRLPTTEKRYIEGLINMMSEQAGVEIPLTIEKPLPKPKLISLPLNPLSMCAGDGETLDYDGECEYVQLFESDILRHCDELVKVSGRSMEPEYYDGDLAMIEHTESLGEGDIGVFVIDGEGMIKQYRKDGLYPLNKKYSVIRPGKYSSFRCFGKVIGKVTPEMMPRKGI